MKKVIALIVSIIMVVSMVMPVFAKPSVGPTPIHIEDGDPEGGPGTVVDEDDPLLDNYLEEEPTGEETPPKKKSRVSMLRYTRKDGIEAVLVLTPYSERNTIIYDKSRREINEAYAEIHESDGKLDILNDESVQKLAPEGAVLEVWRFQELFDLTYYLILDGFVQSDDHGKFEITIGMDNMKNFVCLLHRYNGKWTVVEDAKVVGKNKDQLSFTTEFFSPFAVVVWGDEGSPEVSPKTGDNSLTYAAYAAGIILSMAAVGYVLIKGRKKA